MIAFQAGDYADAREGGAAFPETVWRAALVSGTRTVRYRMYVLTRDGVRIGSVPFADGRVDQDSDAFVQRSMACTVPALYAREIDFAAARLQPAMQLILPDGGICEWPMGVFLPTSPVVSNTEQGVERYAIEAYDQAVVLRDDKLTDALEIPAGTPYLEAAYAQLQAAGISRLVRDETGVVLPATLQFEMGASRLDVVNRLLAAINYRPVWFDAYGNARFTAYIPPYGRPALHSYAADAKSVISPACDRALDTFEIPNVIVCVVSRDDAALTSRWENANPASALSTTRRGRRVVTLVTLEDVADQETLDEYAQRLGNQATAAAEEVSFETLTMPGHGAWDVVHLDLSNDIFGRYEEATWSMDLTPKGRMRHTARKVVMV